jgi:DNA-binding NarL/FixJ family response regulator
MVVAASGRAVRIAGRAREQDLLREALARSVQGSPCTVLVHGEAGVGKTWLVGSVADRSGAAGHAVLLARCLRFGAGASPYLPFVSAFERWLAEGHCAEGLDLAPLYGGEGSASGTGPRVIDRAVARLAEDGPVVLVVDDLQWADVSSMDALAYLIAGRRPQPLALLVTYRDEGIPDGHVLHGWVADMVRMPGVIDMPLTRLSVDETTQQLRDLWGVTPSERLVEEVWTRSAGNALLTELLARDVDPHADELPADLPDALRSALLARWHSLGAPGRAVSQVLAVSGRPVDPTVLAEVAGTTGLRAEVVSAALHEAATAGVVETERVGLVWFRHPLLSEVLYATLLPEEARKLHLAFARALSTGDQGVRAHTDRALHYAGAEMYDESFEDCLLAAGEAQAETALPEAAVLLRQACDLWEHVSPELRSRHGSLPALLAESAQISRLSGDQGGAQEQLERALARVDEAEDPLTAARIVRLAAHVAFTAGSSPAAAAAKMRRAVELSGADPDSEEHALSLADLADAELWLGEHARATEHAEAAVAVADRVGDPATRSYALGALASVVVGSDEAEDRARESLRLARSVGRHEYACLAAIALYNVLDNQGRFDEAVDLLLEEYALDVRYSSLTAQLGVYAATGMIPLGRFTEARRIVREALASRPGGILGMQVREAAVVLALRTGDLDEAESHLHRLRELSEHFEDRVGMHGPGVQVEYLLARGRADEALRVLERTIGPHAVLEPKYADTLLLWGARAATALPVARRRAALEHLVALRDASPVPAFADGDRDPAQRAVEALFAAESARCLGSADEPDQWRTAIPLADAAHLRYVATEARLRLAEALLARHDRREAIDLLRQVETMAQQMAATRLAQDVAALSRSARVPLDEPPVADSQPAELRGLTRRELEVLAHLVAGRSNAEIGEVLFISAKTVSVHVSNLMRKTGTTNRMQAAAWARRTGVIAAP